MTPNVYIKRSTSGNVLLQRYRLLIFRHGFNKYVRLTIAIYKVTYSSRSTAQRQFSYR